MASEAPVRLAGVAEIAAMLSIDEEIVDELPGSEALLRAGTPFPHPLETLLDHGPVWRREDVEAWRERRREAWKRTPTGSVGP